MEVVYSNMRGRWLILFGDSVISIDGQISWASLDELKTDLGYKGLYIEKSGAIKALHTK